MAKFSRSWTQYTQVDKQSFSDAFYKVVRANKTFWMYNALLTYEIGEDCGGELHRKSFTMYKRGRNENRIILKGNILDEHNGLQLVIRVSGMYNYFTTGLYAIFFALLLALTGLQINLISNTFDSVWFVVFCYYLPIYALAYWAVYKFAQWKLNQMQRYYIAVLNEIEKQAMAGKKN
jgi:hypothetical protein